MNEFTSTPRWFALRTKSRHEKIVRDQLANQGIEPLLPTVKRLSQWKDRKKEIEVPLFSGDFGLAKNVEPTSGPISSALPTESHTGTSAGVVVGRVADIRFDNETFEAAVTLRLDKRYAFPKDSSASIMTSGLLGEQYVGLEAGGDSQTLKDKDRILITQSAVVLENLTGQFIYGKAQQGAPQ